MGWLPADAWKNRGCHGEAFVPGNEAWISQCPSSSGDHSVLAHEIGHNRGLEHPMENKGGSTELKDPCWPFQSGNAVSIIIPSKQKDIAGAFKTGLELPHIQCCSSLAVFNASGVVSEKSNISSGPKRGDYSIDIAIQG